MVIPGVAKNGSFQTRLQMGRKEAITRPRNNKLMKLVRQVILKRDKRCLRWHDEDPCGGPSHLSHILPVSRYRKLKYEPKNIKILCQKHHLYWWHKHPLAAAEWLKTALSEDRLEWIEEMRNTIIHEPLNYSEVKANLEEMLND